MFEPLEQAALQCEDKEPGYKKIEPKTEIPN